VSKWFSVLLSVLLLGGSFALCADSGKTVGRKACARCHQPEDRSLSSTTHDNDQSCEDCHGSGDAHVKSVQTHGLMFNFDLGDAAEVRARCGQCHHNPVMEHHATGDVSCIACHSIHHYAQKKYLLKPDDLGRERARKSDPPSPRTLSQN
jgi:hypothetical protein